MQCCFEVAFLTFRLLVCYSCSLPLFKIVVPLCHTHTWKYNYFRAFFLYSAALLVRATLALDICRTDTEPGEEVRERDERKCLSFLIDQHIRCSTLVTPWQCWFRLFFSVTFCYGDVVVFHLCSECCALFMVLASVLLKEWTHANSLRWFHGFFGNAQLFVSFN